MIKNKQPHKYLFKTPKKLYNTSILETNPKMLDTVNNDISRMLMVMGFNVSLDNGILKSDCEDPVLANAVSVVNLLMNGISNYDWLKNIEVINYLYQMAEDVIVDYTKKNIHFYNPDTDTVEIKNILDNFD